MSKIKRRVKETSKIKTSPFSDYWNSQNVALLLVGILILILGFFLMSQGAWDSHTSLTVSTIVLLLGYLVIIPLSIFIKKKKKSKDNVLS